VIADESRRLSVLSTDLLTLARGDEPVARDRVDAVDLSVVVAEVLDARRSDPLVADRLHQELAPGAVVIADPTDLRRILANLVDNAFRYGGQRTHVWVRTGAADRACSMSVTDDGPGIAAADLDRIFEPFFRARADTSAPEGSGLGLAIVRGLARRMGGDVRVTSRPGSGSRFEVSIPRGR
jgi:signal transduction histidine kinase